MLSPKRALLLLTVIASLTTLSWHVSQADGPLPSHGRQQQSKTQFEGGLQLDEKELKDQIKQLQEQKEQQRKQHMEEEKINQQQNEKEQKDLKQQLLKQQIKQVKPVIVGGKPRLPVPTLVGPKIDLWANCAKFACSRDRR
jgi:TolA-binding protein